MIFPIESSAKQNQLTMCPLHSMNKANEALIAGEFNTIMHIDQLILFVCFVDGGCV